MAAAERILAMLATVQPPWGAGLMRRRHHRALTLAAGLLLLLGCSPAPPHGATAPCADGGRRCAAAAAAPGLRQIRRGHRMAPTRWRARPNRESGAPDIGIEARWSPLIERH